MSYDNGLVTDAESLRRVFDTAFAAAREVRNTEDESLLTLRTGERPYALRLIEIAGIHVGCRVVRMPAAAPVAGFMGLVAVRGQLAPAYDLGALLGTPARTPPRWIVITRGATPVALAFEEFEAHARLPRTQISDEARSGHEQTHLRGAVTIKDVVRPLIHVASIVNAIVKHASAKAPKER